MRCFYWLTCKNELVKYCQCIKYNYHQIPEIENYSFKDVLFLHQEAQLLIPSRNFSSSSMMVSYVCITKWARPLKDVCLALSPTVAYKEATYANTKLMCTCIYLYTFVSACVNIFAFFRQIHLIVTFCSTFSLFFLLHYVPK